MKDENYTNTIVIRVKPKTKKQLEKMAEIDRRTLSQFIRIKIEDLVNSSNNL